MQPEDVRYRIIRLIEQRPEITQRELASELGVSLGKVNYCLRALIDKGYIKLSRFRRRPDKTHYAYLLTPAGMQNRAAITLKFLHRKMNEYEQLRQEIETLNAELQTAPGPASALPQTGEGMFGGLSEAPAAPPTSSGTKGQAKGRVSAAPPARKTPRKREQG